MKKMGFAGFNFPLNQSIDFWFLVDRKSPGSTATKTPAADCGSVDLAHRHRRAAAAAAFGAATWGNVQYVQYLL